MRISRAAPRGAIAVAVCTVIGLGAAFMPRFAPRAQSSSTGTNTVITLAVPSFVRDAINDQVITEFETANPGIAVQVVTGDVLGAPSPANDIAGHLDAIQKLVSEA